MTVDFNKLTVPQIKGYLTKRGVQVSGYLKKQLVKLAECVNEIDLIEDPDFQQIDSDRQICDKWKALGCPVDPFKLKYDSDFEDVPAFGLYDVFNYLICSRADYDRSRLAAYKSWEDYRLFQDGHVEDLKYDSISEDSTLCAFRAEVKPTQKNKTYMKKPTYSLWFLVDKKLGEVKAGYCECLGGADGACRHLAAALYALEAFEKTSCTDGPVQWAKRPRGHDAPVPIKRLKIQTVSYGASNKDLNDKRATFDPRHPDDRKETSPDQIQDFAEKLRNVSPVSGVLSLLEDPSALPETENEADPKCLSLTLLKKASNYLHSFTEVTTITSQSALNALSYSEDDISYVEESTVGQADNTTWHKMREGMITASMFKRVCTRVNTIRRKPDTDPSKLLTHIFKEDDSSDKSGLESLEYGRRSEPKARELYRISKRKTHKCLKVDEAGLLVSSKHPFMGCSVDGIVTCKCHPKRLIEIKAPSALSDLHPKLAAKERNCFQDSTGKWGVKKTSDSYYQIQGQMGIYNMDSCDLVIYTSKGIHPITVEFDRDFFEEIVEKLSFFYENYGICYLLRKVTTARISTSDKTT